MSSDDNTTSNSLLQSIRDSGLNFVCQETPWSVYLTLRKLFIRSKSNVKNEGNEDIPKQIELDHLKVELKQLAEKNELLQRSNESVRSDLENTIEKSIATKKANRKLEANSNLHKRLDHQEMIHAGLEIDKTNTEENLVTATIENKALKKQVKKVKNENKVTHEDLNVLKNKKDVSYHNFQQKIH